MVDYNLKLLEFKQDLREQLKENFIEAYNNVFDENSDIKLCGRENCKKLINIANTIGIVDEHYGNEDNGLMCEENLKKLYDYLK